MTSRNVSEISFSLILVFQNQKIPSTCFFLLLQAAKRFLSSTIPTNFHKKSLNDKLDNKKEEKNIPFPESDICFLNTENHK